jgi:hypothetical protein
VISKGWLVAIAAGGLLLAGYGAFAALRSTTDGSLSAAKEGAKIPVPMPVAIKTQAVQAADYSIVSVFAGEAFLATQNDLIRVVVGAIVPGLGNITAVDAFPDGGGTVAGTDAVLRTH